ncbi:MAG: hypothetical protein ACKOAU_09730, partial [Pirellula sp.]
MGSCGLGSSRLASCCTGGVWQAATTSIGTVLRQPFQQALPKSKDEHFRQPGKLQGRSRQEHQSTSVPCHEAVLLPHDAVQLAPDIGRLPAAQPGFQQWPLA